MGVLGEVLDANDTAPNEKIMGRQVKYLIQTHGASEKIRASWSEITADNLSSTLSLISNSGFHGDVLGSQESDTIIFDS